jgi:glycosyltransferase involved in cell wall biosynthesis
MKISVIAPMFNEEANLQNTYSKIEIEFLKNNITNYEIIFVNDGSTDQTWEKAKALDNKHESLKVIGYETNQGRGKALRTGFNFATGDIICTIDFDLSYHESHITRMIRELEENPITDVVLASCYMPGGKVIGVPKFRLFISKTANILYRFAFSPRIYTSTCVVRAYRKAAIKYLELESNGKEIHLELISKILSNGFKIKEIPGTLTRRIESSNLPKRKTFKFRRHSMSHILYFIQEKPFTLFGLIGFVLCMLSFLSSLILLYSRFSGDIEFNNTIVSRIMSPNLIIILFLSGLQMIGLGFLGIQNNFLKKELFKVQRQINKIK